MGGGGGGGRIQLRHYTAFGAGALHELAQPIVRQRFDGMIVAAGHRLVVHQCIDDCFLGGLDHACEKRIHQIVRNCLNGERHLIWIRDIRIRR